MAKHTERIWIIKKSTVHSSLNFTGVSKEINTAKPNLASLFSMNNYFESNECKWSVLCLISQESRTDEVNIPVAQQSCQP